MLELYIKLPKDRYEEIREGICSSIVDAGRINISDINSSKKILIIKLDKQIEDENLRLHLELSKSS